MLRRRFMLGCGCAAFAALNWRVVHAQWTAPGRLGRPDPATDEGGLWAMMDREEQRLRRSGFLIRDKTLQDYVTGIACRLAGDHCPDIRVYLVQTPFFNASMAPNGMMQVWSGLLLRVTNEAQLAAILGHEIGHYVMRHSLERLRDAKSRSAFGQFLGVVLSAAGAGGVGSVAQLALLASMLAYNRDHEREADRIGLDLMSSAGYAPLEASKVWAQLLEELKAGSAERDEYWSESVLFATHPPAEERQKALAEAAAAANGSAVGRTGEDEHRRAIARHRSEFLAEELKRRRFGETRVMLERMLTALPGDGELQYCMGEAHRLRAQGEDLKQALDAYRKAEAMQGTPAELYRSKGLVLRQLGEPAEAEAAFSRYLELKPAAPDGALIRTYLKRPAT